MNFQKIIYIIILISNVIFSQNKDIAVFYKPAGDTLSVSVINLTSKKLDVKFEISGYNFLSKTGRVQKILEKSNRDTILIAKLIPLSKKKPVQVSNISYNYLEVVEQKPALIIQQAKPVTIDKSFATANNIEKKTATQTTPAKIGKDDTILLTKEAYDAMMAEQEKQAKELFASKIPIVFVKDGCPRCQRSEKYITENNMNVRILNTSTSEKNGRLMQYMLEKQYGKDLDKVTMPVILKYKKLTHSHTNLQEVITKL